jgi:hypothetical protein
MAASPVASTSDAHSSCTRKGRSSGPQERVVKAIERIQWAREGITARRDALQCKSARRSVLPPELDAPGASLMLVGTSRQVDAGAPTYRHVLSASSLNVQ